RIAIQKFSPTRTGSTSRANQTRTSPSATAFTSASAPCSRVSKAASPFLTCSPGSTIFNSPAASHGNRDAACTCMGPRVCQFAFNGKIYESTIHHSARVHDACCSSRNQHRFFGQRREVPVHHGHSGCARPVRLGEHGIGRGGQGVVPENREAAAERRV